MLARLSATALLIALAVPVLAETTATITPAPADPCATTTSAGTATKDANATACPAVKPGKLGSGIIPLAGSDHDSESEEDEGGKDD